MTQDALKLTRRSLLAGAAAGLALAALPERLAAQTGEPIRLGALVPLTGAGAPYGPTMTSLHKAVIDEVNAAGGVLGRQIEYFVEDDQVNPDAGVLAARKLIDVDRVSAIMGCWSSSVAAPVLPICWESKVMLLGIASADSLVQLPHQGYFIRTHPHTAMQGQRIADFAIARGVKRFFLMMPQQPYTEPTIAAIRAAAGAKGVEVESLVYDIRKTSYRSEVDQMIKARPDMLFMGGYPADNAVLVKDLYRAGFEAPIIGFASGITPQLVAGAGKAVTEGIYTLLPVPATGSAAYARVQAITGKPSPDTYACQSYDHVNLAILAIAKALQTSGTAIRDTVRSISNGPGELVSSALDGMRLVAEGTAIDYDGASGPCVFEANGNVAECNFQLQQIQDGAFVNLAS